MRKPQQLTRRERWAPYVRQLGDLLRLRDWRIQVNEDAPGDSSAIASCAPVEGRKYAVIRLGESFLTDTAEEQRHTITHELLHCHLGPMIRMIEAHDGLPPAAKLAMEYCVDGLADAIAPLLPLPPASTRSQC
jgi:hypothetical protein